MLNKLKCVGLVYLLIFIFLLCNVMLFSESGIYDSLGIKPERGFYGSVPGENIDLFAGGLTLKFSDIFLPGPNGFDLKIYRVYNSKILRDRIPGSAWGIQQEPYSYVGCGWSMHMGRVHNYDSNQPIIEFPDGRWETAYLCSYNTYYITREFLKYDKANYKLYFKSGEVWTFGEVKTLTYVGYTENVRVVTEIKNSYGHTITITYQTGSNPALKTITDSMGRTVNFVLSNNRLSSITTKNAHGSTSTYYYTVGTFSNGFYQLQQYNPPLIPASTYEYFNGLYDHYELTAINTGLGGRIEYDYDDQTFYFQVQPLQTRVVSEKQIRFSSSDSFKTYTFSYPSYYNTDSGTMTVNGPEYDTNVTYHALSSSNPYEYGWKMGLIKKKWLSDNSYSEEYDWTYHPISTDLWLVLNMNLGPIRAQLQNSVIITRLGDCESKEEFLYERNDVKNYGLPTKVNVYGGASGTTLKHYKSLLYYFESNSTYRANYLIDYIKNESLYSGSTKFKETKTEYYTLSGKYGAIDQIQSWVTGSTYLTWDYTYTSYNPNDITITINLPGSAGTETYRYRYGVLAEITRPGYSYDELTRTISSYSSAILSETNQHNGTMNFTYDALDRITNVDMPSGFNDINASWSTNDVTITQSGGSTIKKYWDGMGRDTGYTEAGDGITLYYRKTLDADGRVVSENKGNTSSGSTYNYVLNDAGNPTQITDPLGKITTITYSDDQKTVIDAEQKQTIFIFEGLPGLHTRLRDPASRYADFTYDAIGRLTQVTYNSSRSQTYGYNGMDQVTSESHPETGTISYTYDTENNLWKRTWGGYTITYTYNTANQLDQVVTGDETITYTYDTRARLVGISSTAGWSRDSITYNSLGAITNERQNIPGLGLKTITYDYDSTNTLENTVYPDAKSLVISNNTLNMPESLVFNSKTLVSQSTYGDNKQPTYLNLIGNGTTFNATYNAKGALYSTSLQKGTTYHYRANYTYDDVGNITDITNTIPSFNANFGYDNLYRLTSASYSGGKSYNFTYDYYGNLTIAKENGTTVSSKSYDSSNQISTSGYDYDLRGNLEEEPNYTYEWNRQNYLTTIKNSAGTVLSTHLYNERGLRLRSSRLPEPAITVLSPNGGENYYVGSTVNITWTSTGIVGNVNIEYSANNGTSWTSIISNTANDGIHAWTLPATPSQAYVIRISETDGSPADTSDAVFTIVALPVITIQSPNGGEQYEVGSTQNIQWVTSTPLAAMKVEYSSNNGSTWIPIIESTNLYAYNWTIPNTPSTTCLVRVTDLGSGVYDVSNAVFTIYEPAYITITSPNGGENWEIASSYNITWTSSGPVGNVKLDYSINSGTSWTTIVSSTSNDGSFTWGIPNNTSLVSNNCMVRITDIDNYPTDSSDSVFSIVLPPLITVTAPNGGENWETNSSHDITWTSQGLVGNVNIDYSVNNGSSWTAIISNTANDGAYTWIVPDTPSSSCLVRVREADGVPSDASDAVFSIVIPASITITSPSGGEYWETGSAYDITWTSTGSVGNVNIEYTIDNGSTWTTIISATPNDGLYTWNVQDNPSLVSSNCKIRITDIDLYPSDISDGFFSIVLPPAIFVTSPNGGESWEVGDYHLITWNSQGTVGDVAIHYSVNNGTSWTTITSGTANDGSFNWNVPENASASCLVRVWETDGDPSDTGDAVFSIVLPSHLKILIPNGGETWAAGSTQQITWTGPGIYSNVSIEYSSNNGVSWTTITNSTEDDGSYSWVVPDTPSSNCLVRIDGAYSDTDPPDISNSVFTITSDTITCGETWINSAYSGTATFNGIAYGNSLYTAVGNDGIIMTSIDGISWTSQTSNTTNDIYGIAFANGMFTAVGQGGVILTSTSGTTWTSQVSTTINTLFGITWNGSLLVAVGSSGTVLTSTDSITWTNCSSGVANTLYSIAYGNNTFVTVGSNGVILTSTSGSTWTSRTSGTTSSLYGVTYGNNLFVAVGSGGTILTGSTGSDWTIRISGITGILRAVAFGSSNSIFVISGDYGEILTGTNGSAWTLQDSSTSVHLKGIIYGNSQFVAVGEGRMIYTTCGSPVPAITLTTPNGSEEWAVGSSHDITWNTTGNVGDVAIDYSSDNGSQWTVIVAATTNDGSYSWVIPDSPSASCLVRVRETDGSPLDVSNTNFTIFSGTEPSLTLTYPNGGETFNTGDSLTITWTSTGTVGNINLDFSINGGSSWQTIAASSANTGAYNWTIPAVSSSVHCLVRIREDDNDRLPVDISDDEFTIVTPAGDSITVVSPNGREVLVGGSNHTITWTNSGTVGNIKIELSIDSGSNWSLIAGDLENTGSYIWTVPDSTEISSQHCLVRISETEGDNALSDSSDAEFTITTSTSAYLNLTSPNGGEVLAINSLQVITWNSNGEMENISLDYSIDNGSNWIAIISSTPNSGSYNWTVPDSTSDQCLVRISEVNGTLSDSSNGVFSIVEQPYITVVSPNGGESWEAGSIYPVTWTSTGTVGLVSIDYSIDNGGTWISLTSSTANDGSFNWLVPDTPSNTCRVRIKGMTDTVLPDSSDAVFSIVSPTVPVLMVTYPNGGESLVAGNSYTVTWNSYGTVADVKLEYSLDNGSNWLEIISSTENDGSFAWTVPATQSSTCLLRVSEIDGDPIDVSDEVFSIIEASTATITVISPNGGEALEVGSSHNITWTWNGDISEVNIDFSGDNGAGWIVVASAVPNNGSYTWTVPAAPGENCLIRVSNGEVDGSPEDISNNVFTIVSTGPALTVTSPNGGEGLVIGTTHEITWMEVGDIAYVNIEYSADNGENWHTIAFSTANDGSYTWTVPDNASNQCLVRISDSDSDSATFDKSDNLFSIVSDSTPTCGSSWDTSVYSGENSFNAVIYSGSKFVTVADNGIIMNSSDGNSWNNSNSNTTNSLYGIAYNTEIYAVVGSNGTIMTSTDSNSWTLQSSGTNYTLNSIIYGNDSLVAFGNNGTLLASNDGVSWTDRSLNISQTLYGGTYGNNLFVVVGSGGVIYTSQDIVTWTKRTSNTSQTLRGVTYGNGLFVAVGENGTILTSSNGNEWSARSSLLNINLLATTYGNGIFVIAGENGNILISTNGTEWEAQSSGIRANLAGAVYGNLRFVAVGVGNIIYSLCDQTESAASALKNQPFLRNPGTVFPKSTPDRLSQIKDNYFLIKPPITLLSPNGNEVLRAGEWFFIKWDSETGIDKVKLQYSPDNGSTYLPIDGDVPNTGYYEWKVPYHISKNCLVRVSEAQDKKTSPHGLVYEGDFKLNTGDIPSNRSETVTIFLGDSVNETIKNHLPRISFSLEPDKNSYIHFGEYSKETGRAERFVNRWHHIQVVMDHVYDCISVVLDGELVFDSIPRAASSMFSPALSFATGPDNDILIEIDDIDVKVLYANEDKLQSVPLFSEDFERLNQENNLDNCGWQIKQEQIYKNQQNDSGKGAYVELNPVTGQNTLILQSGGNQRIIVSKSFHIPAEFPFDHSDKPFEIKYNENMYSDTVAYTPSPGHGGNDGFPESVLSSTFSNLSNSNDGRSTVSETINTYYIYSFDGRLLAEYDQNGSCLRDYIYSGNRLIAEYKPQISEYFYYMNDQINSTRIITNGSGNVVFSEAAGPYGDIQKTWTNAYEPKLKFSGKEREGYSGLDYFGARYFDHKSYRFNSVDPIINKEEALSNPQLWNLYAYCDNNPITFVDPDGRDTICSTGNLLLTLDKEVGRDYAVNFAGEMAADYTQTIVSELVGAGAVAFIPKGLKLLNNLLRTKKSVEFVIKGMSKSHALAKVAKMGLSNAQKAKVLNSLKKVTSTTIIKLIQDGPDVIINAFRKGKDGYQVIETTVSISGKRRVIQKAYNAAGKLVHYHPK